MSYSIFGSRLVSEFISAGKPFSHASSKMIHTAAKGWDPVLYASLVLSFAFSSNVWSTLTWETYFFALSILHVASQVSVQP